MLQLLCSMSRFANTAIFADRKKCTVGKRCALWSRQGTNKRNKTKQKTTLPIQRLWAEWVQSLWWMKVMMSKTLTISQFINESRRWFCRWFGRCERLFCGGEKAFNSPGSVEIPQGVNLTWTKMKQHIVKWFIKMYLLTRIYITAHCCTGTLHTDVLQVFVIDQKDVYTPNHGEISKANKAICPQAVPLCGEHTHNVCRNFQDGWYLQHGWFRDNYQDHLNPRIVSVNINLLFVNYIILFIYFFGKSRK